MYRCRSVAPVTFVCIAAHGNMGAHLEVAAAHSVSFILLLLVPRTERQLVNKVHGHPHLLGLVVTAVPVRLVDPADLVNQALQQAKPQGSASCGSASQSREQAA